jgi:hypothetical protein
VEPTIMGLHEMGVPVTSPVRCISLSEQVAQTLHAYPAPNTPSNRARDVLDILLIETLGQFNYSAAKDNKLLFSDDGDLLKKRADAVESRHRLGERGLLKY